MTIPVNLVLYGPGLMTVCDTTGAELGRARRIRGRWRIAVAGQVYRTAYRRHAAERILRNLAMSVMVGRAISRARLDTYRPDREDRHTGWSAP